MAEGTPGRASNDPMKNVEASKYDDWFKDSPDPWVEVTKLEFGADRSFASDVEILVVNSSAVQWPKLEEKLLTALAASSGRPAAINFLCRQLATIGGEASVEPLTKLLNDPATSDAARVALQPNPSSAVNPALRAALNILKDAPLCGLIGTIAERGDRDALPALERLAADSAQHPVVRSTAQSAISHLRD